jgi:spermidine synthase
LKNTIRIVDIDPVIIQIAKEEFNLDSYADTEIICQDAYEFVNETQKKHGLIIIDLFINNKVPEKFHDPIFWENIRRILSIDGQIIFNTMILTMKIDLLQSIITILEAS